MIRTAFRAAGAFRLKSKRLGLLGVALLAGPMAANAVPVLEEIAPVPTIFIYGSSSGFKVVSGSGYGDVTSSVAAVDLHMPPMGGSTSGCEAADFAGFAAGSIALIQRGGCNFSEMAANAVNAGAAGVLMFNEGNTALRLDAIDATLGSYISSIPVFFTSFSIGEFLSNGVTNGLTSVSVRMKVSQDDLLPVPEPGTLALLGLGLLGLGMSRRRKA